MHGTWYRTQFIPEKLTVKTWNNGRQHSPKLKLLLVLEQSLILRLGGSGVASIFALCRYPVHSILLCPYVLQVSWLIPICSEWWGLFHISSLVLSGWRTEQPSPKYFSCFPCSGSFSEYFLDMHMIKVPWRYSKSFKVYDPHQGRNLTTFFLI